ncbi:MAG: 4-hydroxy-3-methylbut-2-enyl diphosphate reductase [Coriobacteriales bacterium]|jgi:4-hydroxy-3-methylbut-2-enyl diphosphate reductase|nr:4-hydroxy-3-methylbut-2-enyl diphosphate reductase [Coriobacteriales bacterium]
MRIVLSGFAGACYGVERALALVEEAMREGGSTGGEASTGTRAQKHVRTLGPLIHNPRVVADLRERGVEVVDEVSAVDEGVLIIRSHGVPPSVMDEAHRRGLQVVDATCPHVLKAQKAARSLREEGLEVIVVGENGHPEVESIRAHAGEGTLVVQVPNDLPADLPSRIGVVVQTTQAPEALAAVLDELSARGIEAQARNTICSATRQRQQAAARLAHEVDLMIVVGGHNSGNTTRLYEICRAVCRQTHHIESPDELVAAWLDGVFAVGVTAGASTPQEQITSVVLALELLAREGPTTSD